MTTWTKIALVEAVVIVILCFILFWPTEKVDISEYEALKISVSKGIKEREAIKRANKVKIDKLTAERDELKALNDKDETTKTKNNENLQIDIHVIRNSPLDTLIRTEYERPQGY